VPLHCDAIDYSLDAAQEGQMLAGDAVLLCGHLSSVEPNSDEDIKDFISSMKQVAKQAGLKAQRTSLKFHDIHEKLNEVGNVTLSNFLNSPQLSRDTSDYEAYSRIGLANI
jgi:hypothetical protein